MRTPCWTWFPWLFRPLPIRLLLNLVVAASLASCASAMSRKRTSIIQSNRGVDGSKSGNSGSPAGAAPLPVGPEEVARFPHLAPYRGKILLTRENIQVVVSGEQGDWTMVPSAGTVPLVLAVFESRTVDDRKVFLRNPAISGVGIRVECQFRCPSGLGVRFEALEEASPEAGLSGISLLMVSNIPVPALAPASVPVDNKPAARIKVAIGGPGPGILFEALPVDGTALRFAFEPGISQGIQLSVSEGDLVEGGDVKRISYVQADSNGGQILILPGPGSPVSVSPGKSTRIGGLPQPSRWWLYAGDKSVQAGFHAALEQELGSSFRSRTLNFPGAVPSAGIAGIGAPADAWLANDSGDPLLVMNLGRRPVVDVPVETWSENETPMPFVLRVAGVQAGQRIAKVAGSLLKVESEPVEPVSLYGQPATTQVPAAQVPDMVAVVPLGSASEVRKVLMRPVPQDGLEMAGPGILRARRWPVMMQLPFGVYEAFFFSRSRGLTCRVPFDVSRQRESGSVPPVSCDLARRIATPLRLPVFDNVSVVRFDSDKFTPVKNPTLGIEFKVFPEPDAATAETLRELGKVELEETEEIRAAPASSPRTILMPCPVDRGIIDNFRFARLGTAGTTIAIPVRQCSPDPRDTLWTLLEQVKGAGLDVRAVPAPESQAPVAARSGLDAVFPLEPIVASSATGTDGANKISGAAEIARSPGIPDVLGRAGTFLSVGAPRRLDMVRVEVPVRIGRAFTGSRYLDPPWTLRRLRVISEGEVLADVSVDSRRPDYNVPFKMDARTSRKGRARHFRVELAGRIQGVLGSILGVSDEFVVAETQLVEVK